MIPIEHGIILGCMIFIIGLGGVITRRNLIMILMCIEIMLSGVNINLVFLSYKIAFHQAQLISLFIMVIAAAEVTIGLAIAIAVFRRKSNLDINFWDNLKD